MTTSGSIVIRLSSAALCLSPLLAASPAFAQATGQVGASTGPASANRSLESLQQLLLSPPSPRLNVFVTPQYSHEKFDEYEEDGTSPAFGDTSVVQPRFTIDTIGITAGADYLFENGLLLGGSLTYDHANYDFRTSSREDIAAEVAISPDPSAALTLGQPLDREFDEYGITVGVGYLKDPWTVLLTGGFTRRDNIKTEREEYNANQVTADLRAVQEFVNTEGNTDANLYSVELGIAYRLAVGPVSIQPLTSIGFQREVVDHYTENFDAAFQRPVPSLFQRPVPFVPVGEDDILNQDGTSRSTVRRFNGQTIESIPLKAGALFKIPIGDPETDYMLSNVSLGATYTHDFDNQKRTIKGESINFPTFSVEYDEKNRNQDFVSLTGALDFRFGMVRSTFTVQHDIGFDERDYADIIRLQLRVPVSF